MTNETKLEIYKASTENWRELKKARSVIIRSLNRALLRNDELQIEILTKVIALVYSSFAEVSFIKLITTPHGIDSSLIDDIISQSILENKWNNFFSILYKEYDNDFFANKKQDITRIYKQYVVFPSQLRNKIAHGQWKKCLSNKNLSLNAETTEYINQLDFVEIDRLFEIYLKFESMLEDMLESRKAHFRDYDAKLSELKIFIKKSEKWNLDSKRQVLQKSIKYTEYMKKRSTP